MGVRIIESNSDSDSYAVLYCSTSMWAFGPVFDDSEEAEAFLAWYGNDNTDLRLLTDTALGDYVSRFRVWKQTQKRWRIVNAKSGLDLGVYDGANEEEALEELAKDDSWDADKDIGSAEDLKVTEEA